VPPDYAAEMFRSIRWSANVASTSQASSIRARLRGRRRRGSRAVAGGAVPRGAFISGTVDRRRLVYEHMLARPDALYGLQPSVRLTGQGLKLSKLFAGRKF